MISLGKSGQRSIAQITRAKELFDSKINSELQKRGEGRGPTLLVATDGSRLDDGSTGAGWLMVDPQKFHPDLHVVAKHKIAVAKLGTSGLGEIVVLLNVLEFLTNDSDFSGNFNYIFCIDYYSLIGTICGHFNPNEFERIYSAIYFYLEILTKRCKIKPTFC